jgi:hypothetical protein
MFFPLNLSLSLFTIDSISFSGERKLLKKIIIPLFIVLFIFSCGKQEEPIEFVDTTQAVDNQEPIQEEVIIEVPPEKEREVFDTSFLKQNGSLIPALAHEVYLQDEMTFFTLDELEGAVQTAVVGSRVALFYPMALIEKTEDLDTLPTGLPVPISTILPIKGRIVNADYTYYGFFEFEENYNFFYETEWKGQSGLIFGADLEGVNGTNEKNAIISAMYASGNIFEEFPPFMGYRKLREDEQAGLEENRLVFQDVLKNEYYLSLQRPDDMISLYMSTAKDRHTPVFISTDLVAQGLHLFFDKFLQKTEEDFFIPRLERLVDGYLEVLIQSRPAGGSESDSTLKAYDSLISYFQVADCLLELSPEVTTENDVVTYMEKDSTVILANYPENIQNEVQLILNASGPALSPNFNYKEDYSQYKARGHYTKNGVLETYFRTMMWFGRLNLYVSAGETKIISIESEDQAQPTAAQLSLEHFPMVVLMVEITESHPDLWEDWKSLFDPITDLIGMSDDLSFYEMIPFYDELAIEDLELWLGNMDNIGAAIEKAHQELRPPIISGNSVFEAPAEGEGLDRKPPMGWRLFGQRFTWDSYIHQLVSPPRLEDRDIVRGLDIMKVFGSSTADQLLAQSDYPTMSGLEETLDELQGEFAAKDDAFWSESYYNSTLSMIKAQAQFEPGAGFYFTETPMWGIKSLLSSHGTWAALRHDTILYVKQVFGERAGDGDFEPTYRTEPIPYPVHYIEPNVLFFEAALSAVQGIEESGEKYGFLDEQYGKKVQSWYELLERMMGIALKEYNDDEVSRTDLDWIRTIPQQIVPLVIPPDTNYASYTDDEDSLKGAIVADVFTHAELSSALEVGTGIPYRMLVALNDGQGGKRIAVGYTFSYYEFLVGQSERMTNEEWREYVYPGDKNMEAFLPFWSQGLTLEPR